MEATPGSSDNFDELFHHARYFGGVGSSLWKGGDGKLSWDLDQVRSIEAVELVGETRRSDAEIIEIGRFRWAGFFMPAGKADGADWRVARCREAAQKRVGGLSVYAAELPGLQHLSCPYRHEGRRRRVCKELHLQGSNGSLSHLPEQAGHPAQASSNRGRPLHDGPSGVGSGHSYFYGGVDFAEEAGGGGGEVKGAVSRTLYPADFVFRAGQFGGQGGIRDAPAPSFGTSGPGVFSRATSDIGRPAIVEKIKWLSGVCPTRCSSTTHKSPINFPNCG